MIKKLSLLSLLALSGAAIAAEGADSRFNFVSGGVAFDSNGLAKKIGGFKINSANNTFDLDNFVKKSKSSSVGAYLTGAYSFDNNIFLEARLRYLPGRNNGYFAGVGYHYPLDTKTDIYVLGGISQFDLPSTIKLTDQGKIGLAALINASGANVPDGAMDKTVVSFKSQVAPSLEVGVRSMLTEELGVQVAYRATRETIKSESPMLKAFEPNATVSKENGFSHELSLGAFYHFTPQLAAEVGYTYHKLPKLGEADLKDAGANHRGAIGVRYAF